MDIREILVVLRPDKPNDRVIAIAGRLAAECRAYVHGLCVFATPDPTQAECYVVGEAAVEAVVDHLTWETEELIAPARAAFRASLVAAGVEGDWVELHGFEAEAEAQRRTRLVDLVILPRPEDDPGFRRMVETYLVDGGTPCLIVPYGQAAAEGFRRIVIAWSGTREAKRALDKAMPFLRTAEAVEAVVVGDPPQTNTLDRFDALAVYLARHGVVATVNHVPPSRDAAGVILDRCRAFDADLLVMGAYGHARAAEALLGGVSRSILQRAPLPVLMAR